MSHQTRARLFAGRTLRISGMLIPLAAVRMAKRSGPRNVSTVMMPAWENRNDAKSGVMVRRLGELFAARASDRLANDHGANTRTR
jgi:hypothetical protein